MRFARWLVAAATLLLATPAIAQSVPLQGGPWVAGHAPMYSNSGGSQPVIQDSGPAGGGAVGLGMSEGLYVARGTGTPPYAGQGTGPFGSNWCNYDAPITNATGYHFLCLSPNALGGGLLSYGAVGSATQAPLYFSINGTTYQFPAIVSGIAGPSTSVVGDAACWNNTAGNLLKDCGPPLVGPTVSVVSDVACWNNTLGTLLKDCGLKVSGPSVSVTSNVVCWNNTIGTLLSDCGKALPTGAVVGTTDAQTLTNKSITPTFADTLTATGSTQGTALLVAKAINAFTTVASGTGAILPTTDPNSIAISAGFTVEILNAGANSLSVYPPTGQTIEGGAANAPVSIFANGDVRFIYRGASAWYAR